MLWEGGDETRGWKRKGGRRRVPTIPSAWHFRPALKESALCLPCGRTRSPCRVEKPRRWQRTEKLRFRGWHHRHSSSFRFSPSSSSLGLSSARGRSRARVPAAGIRLGDKPLAVGSPFSNLSRHSAAPHADFYIASFVRFIERETEVSSRACLLARLYLGFSTSRGIGSVL